MRFVFAIVAFVVAALMIGLGIAQNTIWAPPDRLEANTTIEGEPRFAMIDGKVLNSNPGLQSLEVSGPGTVFVAYGRTGDVTAWLGDEEYARVTFSRETGELESTLVSGSGDQPAATPTPAPAEGDGGEEPQRAPDPSGSDLWLSETAAQETLSMNTRLPENVSVLVASDGTEAAPNEISITWPVQATTPWVGPLIVGGSILAAVGVALYLAALSHMRKTRGPRRTSGTASPVGARRTRGRGIESGGRRSGGRRNRMAVTVPVLLVPGLMLTGCTAEAWPEFLGGASAPSPSATPESTLEAAIENEDAAPPAVAETQLEAIVADIAETAAQADSAMDEELLRTRFSGPALEQRLANYQIRAKKTDEPVPAAIPGDNIILALPQATDTWPRTIYTIVQNPDDEAAPTLALFLVQQTPRENYTAQYTMRIVTTEPLPEVAPAGIGATRLENDVKLLAMRPDAVATAYADILSTGEASEYYDQFRVEGDTVRELFGPAAQEKAKADLGPTGSIEFLKEPGGTDPIALATIDSGAIVATSIREVETTKPADPRATLKVNGGATEALLGLNETSKGVELVYTDQLLFYVPPVNSGEEITLLGFDQQLVSAKELP
ncbi:hypothetical protein [Planctomonas psychrotolerans]|uniref:hypothetical protein n=1 Tax=Planctomonas psychrotolerans TaxID=2528712 RepID=UPI00123AF50C|nr:hypothetical protein [Planctomonas psychrotolerans]